MTPDNSEALTNLVRNKYGTLYDANARFKNTVDGALAGNTDNDVLALLVAGLATSCREAADMRRDLIELIARTTIPYPNTTEPPGADR